VYYGEGPDKLQTKTKLKSKELTLKESKTCLGGEGGTLLHKETPYLQRDIGAKGRVMVEMVLFVKKSLLI